VGCTHEDNPIDLNAQGNFIPFTLPGMNLTSVADIMGVDDGFADTEFYHVKKHVRYQKSLDYFGDYELSYRDGYTIEKDGLVGSINDIASDAELIILELGMCDVFNSPFEHATKDAFSSGFSLSNTDEVLKFVELFIKYMTEGYATWTNAYPLLIDRLQELNPDAEIIIVGACNLLYNVTISDDTLLPIGTAVGSTSVLMNQFLKKLCGEKGVIYVDISNTDLGASQYDFSLMGDFLKDEQVSTHPTTEGHAYIARQILNALPREDGSVNKISTDIRVDLGFLGDVDYVLLDNKAVTDFKVENNVLTVSNTNTNAKVLTVGIIKDGNLSIAVYQLEYNKDTGYTPYRIYSVNSVAAKINSIANTLKTVFGKLSSLFFGSKIK